METKTLKNPQTEGKKNSKSSEFLKEAGKFGAASMAGAMGGFAAAIANDKIQEEVVEQEPEPVPESEPTPDPATIPEPEPEPEPLSDEPEPIIDPEPIEESNEEENDGKIDSVEDEVVDPELIADAIIAGEEVDPYDMDMAEVVNFDEIGTVYTVDGESYTAALFHDENGEQYVMVDVDDDDVFDIISTTEGEVVELYAGNLTVEDAEIGINDDPVYLAANDDMPEIETTSGEEFANDIINS